MLYSPEKGRCGARYGGGLQSCKSPQFLVLQIAVALH
jgi:hypothetical protein